MATYTYQTTAKAYMNHPSGHPFMTATEARNKARSDSTILHEIRLMEQKVMTDAAAGLLSSIVAYDTTIGNDTGTTITNETTGPAYFNVWKGSTTDKVKEDQMKQVILHFESHGYTIYRNTNATVTTIFNWTIEW
jgi:hypothetical protein